MRLENIDKNAESFVGFEQFFSDKTALMLKSSALEAYSGNEIFSMYLLEAGNG